MTRDTELEQEPRFCWVGGEPAHYMRAMHKQLERQVECVIIFFYIQSSEDGNQRSYERGDMPDHCEFFNSSELVLFWRRLNRLDPDHVILAGHFPRLVMLALLWAKINCKTVSYTCDTNTLDLQRQTGLLPKLTRIWHKLLFRCVDTHLYIGLRNRDYIVGLLGKKLVAGSLHKVPYPAIVGERLDRRPSMGAVLKVLFLGRLVSFKAVDQLLRALPLLRASVRSSVHLTVVGDGPELPFLQALTQELYLMDNVTFIGAVASNRVSEHFTEANLFVLPSHAEPWGLVVNEALAFGVPVATPYWVGAAADLVIDNFSGFAMEDNEPATIASTIERALALGGDRLRQMGANGRTLVIDGGFHLNAAAQSLAEHIGSIPIRRPQR